MQKPKSSLILSPNLGCPEIVSLRGISKDGFRVVIAAPVSEEFNPAAYRITASPSFHGQGRNFELEISDAQKLDDEALPPEFNHVSETRLLISTTLRTEVLPQHSFWAVWARPKAEITEEYMRVVSGTRRSTLYDLTIATRGQVTGRVRHALFLRVDDPTLKFVHLTDLHVAARNDLWEAEVRAVMAGSSVTPGPLDFKNLNLRLRDFIRWANRAADMGQLDFVLMLGDLVDFGRTGLFDRTEGDTNWPTLIEILTGSPAENERRNEGLRVPIFTTTGNHDFRTYPYSPTVRLDIFGISKKCAEELDFWYRNTSVEIGEKLEEVSQKLIRKGSPLLARSWWGAILNMGARGVLVGLQRLGHRARAVGVAYGRQLLWAIFGASSIPAIVRLGAAVAGPDRVGVWHLLAKSIPNHERYAALLMVLLCVSAFVTFVASSWFYAWLRTTLEGLIAIEADVNTLCEYFLQLNPYFNYAFQLENCYFVVMDTGPDCLTAQSFWDDGGKKVRRISIKDNILGGSPDTMGFYPANECYPYSQIGWLERVLSCIGNKEGQKAGEPRKCRVFVGLHAPPANLSEAKRKQADDQQTVNPSQPYVLMRKDGLDGYDIRYGTVNHYLSQFFYLCLGYREGQQDQITGPGIDVVFAGHAHWRLEFWLRKPEDAAAEWSPELLYGNFSQQVEANCHNGSSWWGPLLLQTAACGPASDTAKDPPDFRYVTVDGNADVCNLRARTLKDPPPSNVASARATPDVPARSRPANRPA